MIALLFAVLWLALCASIAQDLEDWEYFRTEDDDFCSEAERKEDNE